MRLTRLQRAIALTACSALAACASAAHADAAVARLRTIAAQSVVAVQGHTGVTTGFGFGPASVVVGTTRRGPLRIITANGVVADVNPDRRAGDISAANRGAAAVASLRAAQTRPRYGEVGYLLGPPLGYAGNKIRRTVLQLDGRAQGDRLRVMGTLPRSFLGAPVVTSRGRVLGAVGSIGARSWALLSVAGVNALIAAPVSSSGGVSAIDTIIGLAFVVITVAAIGAIVMRRRRRNARHPPLRRTGGPDVARLSGGHADASPSAEPPTQPLTPAQPLVRRRDPPPADDLSDFDVVVKSQQVEP